MKTLLKLDVPCVESALASTSGTSATKHTAETCKGNGLQEPGRSLDRDRKIRTGGDVDGGGGTEFFASQDESHEEDAGDQATAEEGEGRPHTPHTHTSHTHTRRTPGRRQRGP